MVHGLTGTPFELRWLGEELNKQGYTVYGPRLAGHGTCPEDLTRVTWREWYADVLAAYELLGRQCDKIFVIGLSMGGVLTLLLGSQEKVDGLVVLSAPHEIKHPLFRFLPLLSLFIKIHNKGYDVELEERFARQVRKVQEERGEALTGHPSYKGWVIPAIRQFLPMLSVMRENLKQVTAPILFIHSKKDQTVPFENMQLNYDAVSSPDKSMLVLEESCHTVAEDIEYPVVFDAVKAFIAQRV
nr:alpha/beta fold hydrolase [Anaerolineae bacterium]